VDEHFAENGYGYCIDCCKILMRKAIESVVDSDDCNMMWVVQYLENIAEGMGIEE